MKGHEEPGGGRKRQRVKSDDMPEPAGKPEALRPSKVVTDAQGKLEYDKQLRETMKFMKSGKPMPETPDTGGASSSSGGAVAPAAGPVQDHKGTKRGAQVDDGDNPHKSWRVDALEEKSDGGMTYEDLCATIREEFPDLAVQWCQEFPELRVEAVDVGVAGGDGGEVSQGPSTGGLSRSARRHTPDGMAGAGELRTPSQRRDGGGPGEASSTDVAKLDVASSGPAGSRGN